MSFRINVLHGGIEQAATSGASRTERGVAIWTVRPGEIVSQRFDLTAELQGDTITAHDWRADGVTVEDHVDTNTGSTAQLSVPAAATPGETLTATYTATASDGLVYKRAVRFRV